MKFRYLAAFGVFDSQGKMIKRPVLEIELVNKGGEAIETFGLVDSGADISMINMHYAEGLGLKIDKKNFKYFIGAGNGKIKAYSSSVRLRIKNTDYEVKIPIWFTRSKNVNVLIGQEGFFDAFKIKFEKSRDTFEITKSRYYERSFSR